LQLLIVPAVLAAGAIGINASQTHRDAQREDKRRAQQDRIAANGRRDDALRAYLQQMSGLIADHRLAKVGQREGNSLAGLAQSLTLTVLRQLDGPRKGQVVQFLVDSKLIVKNETTDFVIDLYGANLHGAKLGGAILTDAYFNGADFTDADLHEAVLNNVDFSQSNLQGTNFSRSFYVEVDDQYNSAPQVANFSNTCLTGARFTGARLWDSTFHEAEGRSVDFSDANFEDSRFGGAKLTNVIGRHTEYGGATFPKGWEKPRGLPMKKRISCRFRGLFHRPGSGGQSPPRVSMARAMTECGE
ncbi:MAG: pentapeptide repeat-containing protein, partial [Actinobacteria bacterium]|nr:pentapeptide repeat-containing protein [Actinomycetota bacterium]